MPVDPWRGMKESTNILSNLYGQDQSSKRYDEQNRFRDEQAKVQQEQNAFNRGIATKQDTRAQAQSELNQLVTMEKVLSGINSQRSLDTARAYVEKTNPDALKDAPTIYNKDAQIWLRGQADEIKKIKGWLKTEHGVSQVEMTPDEFTQASQAEGVTASGRGSLTQAKEPVGTKPGTIRTFQRGDKTVTEEYTGSKWVEKATGDKFSPSARETKSDKPELTEKQAREELLSIKKYRYSLDNTGGLTPDMFAMIASSSPELAEKMQSSDPKDIKTYLDEYEQWVSGFVPDRNRPIPEDIAEFNKPIPSDIAEFDSKSMSLLEGEVFINKDGVKIRFNPTTNKWQKTK